MRANGEQTRLVCDHRYKGYIITVAVKTRMISPLPNQEDRKVLLISIFLLTWSLPILYPRKHWKSRAAEKRSPFFIFSQIVTTKSNLQYRTSFNSWTRFPVDLSIFCLKWLTTEKNEWDSYSGPSISTFFCLVSEIKVLMHTSSLNMKLSGEQKPTKTNKNQQTAHLLFVSVFILIQNTLSVQIKACIYIQLHS